MSTTAAIMAKVFYLSLLVLLLMTCAVESRPWIGTNQLLKECKCIVTPKRVACLKQFRPQTHEQKMDILKCLCRKHHLEKKMNVNLRYTCRKMFGGTSIPLTLV